VTIAVNVLHKVLPRDGGILTIGVDQASTA
jgi:hypothetical protein